MTFSHKTLNIPFHTRKFLSDKHALNTHAEATIVLCSLEHYFVEDYKRISRNTVSIFSLYSEVYTTERLTSTQNIWYYETRIA